jgi:acyl-homoserine-lactone acylase
MRTKSYRFALILFLPLFAFHFSLSAQPIDPQTVTITRDTWGVPHVHAKTDAGAAYGLAWANAEDNFHDIQLNMLMARHRQGEVLGKEGAIVDYAVQILRVPQLIEEKYETDVSPSFKNHLQAYCQGLNEYAAAHPKEVLAKKVFPVHPKDVLAGYVMSLVFMQGAHHHLINILEGRPGGPTPYSMRGSNGFAFNSYRSRDGEVYLVNNSHQPLDGPLAWYEAHISSDEGLNVLGGLFPGGVTIFAGCNPDIGWMHTVNQPDLVDVYKITMNPDNKLQYKMDGKWLDLSPTKAKLKVKVGPSMIHVTKKAWWSVHGPVLKAKDNAYYALRIPALMTIKAAEQWLAMNKARNFTEFHRALEMGGLPSLNVIYADRRDTIFYLDNGLYPKRKHGYDWLGLLPGDTTATLWTEFHDIHDLPQLLNPASGYVFNTNNTPFHCSGPAESPRCTDYDSTLHCYPFDNNRSMRVAELVDPLEKVSWEDLLKIKYDRQYPKELQIEYLKNVEVIFHMSPDSFPEIKEELAVIKAWDRRSDVSNTGAALFIKINDYLYEDAKELGKWATVTSYPEAHYAAAIDKAGKFLRKHFGKIDVPLGQFQRHVRGDQDYPIGGAPDVISAMYSHDWKNGRKRSYLGDSYIQLIRFTEEGVKIQSVQPYGNSNVKGSPHYDDQIKLYLEQQTKEESLDAEWVKSHAERTYHPGK